MSQTATLKQKIIGLALSGGGMRAAAFHAGVLKYLAEQNLLENVVHISSVSGGSLFTGLVFRLGQYKWPTSNEYIKNVLPNIGQIFTSKSLQRQTFRKWIGHWYNLRLVGLILVLLYLYCVNSSIALVAVGIVLITISYWFRYTKFNALSKAISQSWDIKATLSQLPDFPVWPINATSTETGRRFRFKGIEIGDYETQYTNAPQFLLAKAMAISASVPILVEPMRFKTSQLVWKKSKKRPLINKDDPSSFTYLHLYDGGIYDNLGMEPLFDAGEQTIKAFTPKINYLLVSDGGAIFEKKPKRFFIKDITLYRIMNIIMDQVHALRMRSFVNFLQNNPNSGVYVGIGKNFKSSLQNFREKNTLINNVAAEKLEKEKWLSEQEVNRAKDHDTDLKSMTKEEFNCLVLHGYETAKWNVELFWDNI